VLSLQTIHRRQVTAVLVGVPLPWLANILYIIRISPIPNWDLAPIAFGLTALILTLGIYRFRFLDLAPLARNLVYESLADGLVVLDGVDRIVDINPSAVRMAKSGAAAMVGQPFATFFPALGPFLLKNGLQEVLLEGDPLTWMEMSVADLSDSHQKRIGRLVVLHDITERKRVDHELEQKSRDLARLAVTDGLTQLYNRRHAEEALKTEFQRAERYQIPLALAMFDIDLFKQINDNFGHGMGDDVLREVSLCLRETMRTTDIIARVGGDEFLVLLPNTTLLDAWQAVERLRGRLSGNNFAPIGEPVTISGGVTAWFAGDKPDTALRRVDRLLYKAKAAGRKTILMDQMPVE
jgi:diguanylate cyclase (GGDEF)-like protein